ncbi:hypothetical protein IMCC21906_01163 [Spongiibacter sp. IMCC21906]|jgi:DNA-nicking Smr family endonuclease|uniref:DNA endonuclease SmrA n=1 Tax=Spongiibacter sp. IMCC21906 TaxID=1620392 RepID=UPI00062E09BF|nr:DNA endonuclease SmrA [Spongiibacter sp. IMCC21906]AKH68842.1 hypothetical protein IMCC21906_01163 [Spongiibacter sp. IMCC21906]
MSDEDKVFADEMVGVKPLQSEVRVALKRGEISRLSVDARRQAAVAQEAVSHSLSTSDIPILDPYYLLEFRRDGVQLGVFRKLKQGKYTIEARLDLHKMTVEQASQQVFNFIRDAMAMDLRTVMIVHGRGFHNKEGGAVLKSYINHWLPEMADVQAYSSAQPQHGGAGAVYIMLRKSERKKQENRDKLTRGRSL